MKNIFEDPEGLEHEVKKQLGIPDYLMMENAAVEMAGFIRKLVVEKGIENPSVLIVCGKGNNGGDGYALARHLADFKLSLCSIDLPSSREALTQFNICKKLAQISEESNLSKEADIVVDCIYGIGFRDEFLPGVKKVVESLNEMKGIKIACDVPSGLRKDGTCADGIFKADYTLTMGTLKTALFSDKAKTYCGKIIPLNLGIPSSDFESFGETKVHLVEESDASLPVRKNPGAHKGSYGHTVVFAGEKSGAAVLAATAALNFGSGLSTLLKTVNSNLIQFKISPELMISQQIPKKSTSLVIGSGLGYLSEADSNLLTNWFNGTRNPAVVLDADIFNVEYFISLLNFLNGFESARIVLTPHIAELNRFLEKVQKAYPDVGLSNEEISVQNLSESISTKIKIGKILNVLFPKTTVVMKSANTFIATEGEIFVVANGTEALAKGGSGDVLAGMTGALLAQGYSSKDAAVTACYFHAKASVSENEENYSLTPEKLISRIG